MKEIRRDVDGKIIVPEGMIYIKEHPSWNKKGLVPKQVMVVEHYRKRKRKKEPEGYWFRRLLSILRR